MNLQHDDHIQENDESSNFSQKPTTRDSIPATKDTVPSTTQENITLIKEDKAIHHDKKKPSDHILNKKLRPP